MDGHAVSRQQSLEAAPPLSLEATEAPTPTRVARLLDGRGWLVLQVAVDAVMLVLAVLAARIGAEGSGFDSTLLADSFYAFAPAVLALMALRGVYRRRIQLAVSGTLAHVVGSTSLAAISVVAISAFAEASAASAPLVGRAWVFATAYLVASHLLLDWIQRRARVNRVIAKPTLIVGAGRIGTSVERRLRLSPQLGLLPVGYLDDDPLFETAAFRDAPLLGAPSELVTIAHQTGARHVVLGFTRAPDEQLFGLVRQCAALGIEVLVVPRMFESVNERVALDHIGGLPLVRLRFVDPQGWQFTVKHGLDRLAALGLLAALSPVVLAVAIAVPISSPGPVLFKQRRIGRDGRDFDMLKFRSMRLTEDQAEAAASGADLLPEDTAPGGVEGTDRRTPVGTFLRRRSLDELPQLVNVLRGEMSLVGPRPERPEFVSRYDVSVRRYSDRHRVKSGLTGLAQVNGLRGQTSLSDRLEWDNHYIENWSLWMDLKILVRTLAAPFRTAE